MSQKRTRFREFLEENPRWIGITFSALLLLSQVGTVAAGSGNTHAGP